MPQFAVTTDTDFGVCTPVAATGGGVGAATGALAADPPPQPLCVSNVSVVSKANIRYLMDRSPD